nr:hypothetical protein Itr_chr09CG18920 [Ipomoea trifida]GMD31359.1 hypothetical protein Iba_chr09aCG15730 [Ipomoea batatas]GMD36267.1 hypothetical protein Iba_chr09dCG14800 [Ipomoea batatas]
MATGEASNSDKILRSWLGSRAKREQKQNRRTRSFLQIYTQRTLSYLIEGGNCEEGKRMRTKRLYIGRFRLHVHVSTAEGVHVALRV